MAQVLLYSGVSYCEYLAVTNELNLGDVWKELLIALGIVIINSILIPLSKLLFSKIKTALKKHQKTTENDGEIADILLNAVDKTQDKVEEALNKISNKGDNNGKDNGNN